MYLKTMKIHKDLEQVKFQLKECLFFLNDGLIVNSSDNQKLVKELLLLIARFQSIIILLEIDYEQ